MAGACAHRLPLEQAEDVVVARVSARLVDQVDLRRQVAAARRAWQAVVQHDRKRVEGARTIGEGVCVGGPLDALTTAIVDSDDEANLPKE